MYEVRLTDGTTGAHIRTFHATRDNLSIICTHAADEAVFRADHASDNPRRPRADDIARNLRAGIGCRIWHADTERAQARGNSTDLSLVRVA